MAWDTNFEKWLKENVDTTDYEEVYALCDTLETAYSGAGFDLQPEGHDEVEWKNRTITHRMTGGVLVVASEKMRKEMIRHIRSKYMDDMDTDAYLQFHRSLEEDN